MHTAVSACPYSRIFKCMAANLAVHALATSWPSYPSCRQRQHADNMLLTTHL